ncbi:MAG: DNA-processing protein DprA [Bacilli bacterium]
MLEGREILLYLTLKYDGRWDDVYKAVKTKEMVDAEEVETIKDKIESKYVTIIDDDYPNLLKKIHKPPFVIFYYGNLELLNEKTISIVGTRSPSEYGLAASKHIVKGIKENLVVVSGLSLGIDKCVLEEALNLGLGAVGILGSGIDLCYPKPNLELYLKLKTDGLLLSEYPNLLEPLSDHFPMRNRIIAGLSRVLLISEAHEKSATSITVGYALHNGCDVCAIPDQIFTNSFCNKLIKDGAYPIISKTDVLELYNMKNT